MVLVGECRAYHDFGYLGISLCSVLNTFSLCWPQVFLAKEGREIGWNVPGDARVNSPADWLNFLKKPWIGISATLPATHIFAPENGWLEYDFCVSFWDSPYLLLVLGSVFRLMFWNF